jgi:hypothetical protein
MLVMGGCPADEHGEVFALDTTSWVWSRFTSPSAPQEVKAPRSEHCAALWNQQMVVFGGLANGTPLNSLILFNIKKGKWTVLKNSMPAVHGHSCFVKDDVLFVVGGFLQTETPSSFIACSLNDGSSIATGNYLPKLDLNLALLTACFDPIMERLYIFGGFAVAADQGECGCTDHLHIINLKTQKLVTLYPPLVEDGPSPRCGHSMVPWGKDLILFGGCNRLPLLTGEWVFCDFSSAVWNFTAPSDGFGLGS